MPNLQVARIGPGSFITRNKQFLYAYGGRETSIERIDLGDSNFWHVVQPKVPDQLKLRYGFALIPVWKLQNFNVENIAPDDILMFGGKFQTDIYLLQGPDLRPHLLTNPLLAHS